MFYYQNSYGLKSIPHKLSISCANSPGQAVTFKLIAANAQDGMLFILDTGYDDSRTEEIFRLTAYGNNPWVEFNNSLMLNSDDLDLRLEERCSYISILRRPHVRFLDN